MQPFSCKLYVLKTGLDNVMRQLVARLTANQLDGASSQSHVRLEHLGGPL